MFIELDLISQDDVSEIQRQLLNSKRKLVLIANRDGSYLVYDSMSRNNFHCVMLGNTKDSFRLTEAKI